MESTYHNTYKQKGEIMKLIVIGFIGVVATIAIIITGVSDNRTKIEVWESWQTQGIKDLEEGYYHTAIQEIARMVLGEDGNGTKEHQSAVIWTVLNRVDEGYSNAPSTMSKIVDVVTDGAYHAYRTHNEVRPDLYDLAYDVLERYFKPNQPGRTLPKGYCWFSGYYGVNWFRNVYEQDEKTEYWDWSLDNPYEY